MMRLQAKVRVATGQARHILADRTSSLLSDIPRPETVEIQETDGAFYLFRLDRAGKQLADTWHRTLDEAKAQAELEYAVAAGEWTDMRH